VRTAAVLLLATVFLLFGLGVPQRTSASTHRTAHRAKHHATHQRVRIAPADEYFGRLKMSILGIQNQLRDLALRLKYSPAQGEAILGSAVWVEDAMHDWEHKYPADPWLPKSVFNLAALYANVHSAHGDTKTTRCLHWLLTRYPHTHYARLARVQFKRQVGLRSLGSKRTY
jgi:hypothetical protein